MFLSDRLLASREIFFTKGYKCTNIVNLLCEMEKQNKIPQCGNNSKIKYRGKMNTIIYHKVYVKIKWITANKGYSNTPIK
jgi:hypothetical protein